MTSFVITARGEVITVPQNTRFPQAGYFDLSGSTVRVT